MIYSDLQIGDIWICFDSGHYLTYILLGTKNEDDLGQLVCTWGYLRSNGAIECHKNIIHHEETIRIRLNEAIFRNGQQIGGDKYFWMTYENAKQKKIPQTNGSVTFMAPGVIKMMNGTSTISVVAKHNDKLHCFLCDGLTPDVAEALREALTRQLRK